SVPPDPRLLRVLRLAASGVASLGTFDLQFVEEVRVCIDELGSALIAAGSGAPIDFSIELTTDGLLVEGSTVLAPGTDLHVDPLIDQILAAVATTHEWTAVDGVARGRFERLATPA
ncbi:MAG: hypothetical protein Q8K72_11280, partial [Acidimicrobiales bacterium]|nr:hypothetical protein [Acidimicrobiales bacterium]